MSSSRPKGASAAAAHSIGKEVQAALVWLERRGTKRNRDGLARYAIRSEHVLDVSVADIRAYAKQLGPNHQLALALWKTGVYEARMLVVFQNWPLRAPINVVTPHTRQP